MLCVYEYATFIIFTHAHTRHIQKIIEYMRDYCLFTFVYYFARKFYIPLKKLRPPGVFQLLAAIFHFVLLFFELRAPTVYFLQARALKVLTLTE